MSSQASELAGSQLKIGNVQIIYRPVIRASRRSPSPRGGRRNHRAAGRPEIARACGRPRAPPSSSMPASSPAAASRSRSTARPVSDRPPLRRDNARDEGARIIEYDHVWAPTARHLVSWLSNPRAGGIARNAPVALTPSRGVRVQTWVRPKRAPATAARGAGTSSAVGVGPTFMLDLARACGSGLATTSRTRLRAIPRRRGRGHPRKITLLRRLGHGEPLIRSARYEQGVAPLYERP